MSRRVLVTGSAGFIGVAVARALADRGDILVPFDHPNDIRNHVAVVDHVRHVDAVINLAGRLGTSETFGSERSVADVNIMGALNIAEACHSYRRPLVQIGTGHKGQPNPYAITKACAEDLLLGRAGDQHVVVVRAYHAYGPYQKPCPPHGTSPVRKIIPSFVCRALTGMPIEINGSGAQLVDLVHVDEVARILVEALDAPSGSVLEAGTGHGMRVDRVAEEVRELCGSSSPIVHLPQRRGEPACADVVATSPAAEHPWPWKVDETIAHYRGYLEAWARINKALA